MDEIEKRNAICQAALSWMQTPYHHHARVKGVGVDCANLLVAAYHEAGLAENIDLGFYPHDWHMHRSQEMFLEWVDKVGLRRIDSPKMGDVAVFKFGRTFSHGAIMTSANTAIHSYIDMGVIISRLDEAPLQGREVQYWSKF